MIQKFTHQQILIFIITVGTAIRLLYPLTTSFPLNDGGLFYTMTNDLINNNFLPPEYTSYNNDQIPFAYPPLGFYLIAILNSLTKIDLLLLFQYLPTLLSILTIPIFYLLAKLMVGKKEAKWSTLAYSILPNSYLWLIMGGGVTRSLGAIFYMLSICFFIKSFESSQKQIDTFLAFIFLALTTLSHPEWTLYLFVTLSLIIVFKKVLVTKYLAKHITIIIIYFIIILPYFMTVIFNHGMHPYINAFLSGTYNSNLSFFNFTHFFQVFNQEKEFVFFGVLAIIGLVRFFLQKNYLLILLFLIPFILFPRNAQTLTSPFFAMIVGNEIYNQLSLFSKSKISTFSKYIGVTFITVYLFISFGNYYNKRTEYGLSSLTPEVLSTFEWIQQNTSKDTVFYVDSGLTEDKWSIDSTKEWFPALTGRKNANVYQGYEWKERPYWSIDLNTNQSTSDNLSVKETVFKNSAVKIYLAIGESETTPKYIICNYKK